MISTIKVIPFLALAFSFVIAGCGEEAATPEDDTTTFVRREGQIISEPVGAQKFSELMNEKGVLLLDVRTEEEIQQGMIPGAKHLEYGTAELKEQMASMDRSTTILVYCAGGGRSDKVRTMMLEQGYETVYELVGGVGAWQEAGLTLEKPN